MNLCICAMLSFVMKKTATVLSLFRIAKMTIGRPISDFVFKMAAAQ